MSETMNRKSILEMANGAFLERVDYEMGKVIDNILDPNTKPTAKRKITVAMELTPDDDRCTFKASTTAKVTLVPTDPVTTRLCIDTDPGTGELIVVEMQPQIPGQTALSGEESSEPKVLKFMKQA